MWRALCLLLGFSSFAFCQTLNVNLHDAASPSSATEVVYVVDSSTLTTYNVDQQMFQATQVGTTTLPRSKYPGLVTSSPDGQFLYYLTNYGSAGSAETLYVYDTNATGVPGNSPVQAMSASQLASLTVNPAGTFLYSVAVGPTGPNLMTQFSIVRNAISSTTGTLSQPVTEATYDLDTDVSGNDCGPLVLGFNPAGTEMYDEISCGAPHGSGSETINQRSVDLQTGALGPDEEVYFYSYYAASGYAGVQFRNNLMFIFLQNFDQGPDTNSIDIYQTQPFSSTPLVNCTATMLSVCGDYSFALAHPSGQYVFIGSSDSATDIDAVNLSTQQITQVNSLPYGVWSLSPDGKVVYGSAPPSARKIYISGFNAENGEVKLGGTIVLPNSLDSWFTAVRY